MIKTERVTSLSCSVTLCLAALVALLCLADTPARARASIRFVAPTGIDSGFCTSPTSPCRTVQYAVDRAASGDVIKVAAGHYTRINQHGDLAQIGYIDKSLTIRGGYLAPAFADPPNPEINLTTFDAQRLGRVLYITGPIEVTIEGLRVTGGDAEDLGGDFVGGDVGSGVYISGATVVFNGNQVFSNTNCHRGGGLYLANSNSTLMDNTFNNNRTGSWGGGIFLYESGATLSNNTFANNVSGYAGGGMYVYKSEVSLDQDTFTSNVARGYGGGMCLNESKATVSASDFSNNSANGGASAHHDGGGGLFLEKSEATISDSGFFANSAASYGGGLCIYASIAALTGNTVTRNIARYGGGLDLAGDTTLVNNVIADNQTTYRGAGVYFTGVNMRLIHTTIVGNHGGDGIGILVTNYGFHPNVSLTNTILLSHTVGLSSGGATVTLEATLWGTGMWANDTDWTGTGTIVTGTVNIWGDPDFVDPQAGDYRIGANSAARDYGVDAGVIADIDHQPRPYLAPDLGADEYWPPGALKRVYLPVVVRDAP